jgi:SAM-dependent methyltransferase
MIDQALLAVASQACLDAGVRVLQGYRLADTDAAHVDWLLRYMNPAPGTSWLDIGAGFGEVARLMSLARPDLRFTLLNNNAFQNARAPDGFRVLDADMHAIPAGDETYDGCMMLYALCHADDFTDALREAARVTKMGGKLFAFDYIRDGADNGLMRKHLAASALTQGELQDVMRGAGWRMDFSIYPGGDDRLFREMMGDDALYNSIFENLNPVVWRATREH